MANIGLDIDGVLADFTIAFINWYNSRTTQTKINLDDWYFGLHPHLFKIEHQLFLKSGQYIHIKPYPGTPSIVNRMSWHGHNIYYVTSRPKELLEDTIEWLIKYGFPKTRPGGLIMDNAKHLIAKRKNLDFFLDDNPQQVRSMEHTQTRAFLARHSYNAVLFKQYPHIPTANLSDILTYACELERRDFI